MGQRGGKGVNGDLWDLNVRLRWLLSEPGFYGLEDLSRYRMPILQPTPTHN